MSTRTIVTSQPDVACEVCERRLLRGEQPDVFLAAGRRLIVCELCAPRAASEGWTRESDASSVELPPARPRRGRSLLERLLGTRVAPEPSAAPGYEFMAPEAEPPARGARRASSRAQAVVAAAEEPLDPFAADPGAEPDFVSLALELFNGSEHPRRIAGLMRSLGRPQVSVRSAEHLSSVVVIVVSWELCWYRYEVDLSDGLREITVREQGSELSELAREDRLANARAQESGMLELRGR